MKIGLDMTSLFAAHQPAHAKLEAPAAAGPTTDQARKHAHEGQHHEYRKRGIRRSEHLRGDATVYDRRGTVLDQPARLAETAPATEIQYRRTERTTLRITTQEGDVVKLKFSARDALSAEGSSSDEGETTIAELQVRASSSTRLRISIRGDINAAEFAAIQSVVEQAGALAAEFFGGGAANAFASASELGLNAEQLAQVKLKFALKESLTYSGPLSLPTSASDPVPATPATTVLTSPQALAGAAQPPAIEQTTAATDAIPAAPAGDDPSAAADVSSEAAPPATAGPVDGFQGLIDLLGTIAAFLERLVAIFSTPEPADPQATTDTSQFELQFDLSFKLRLLSSILVSAEPAQDESEPVAVPELVPETLNALAAENQAGLETVA